MLVELIIVIAYLIITFSVSNYFNKHPIGLFPNKKQSNRIKYSTAYTSGIIIMQ